MDGIQPYLIDWLTLRLPISAKSHPAIYQRVAAFAGHIEPPRVSWRPFGLSTGR